MIRGESCALAICTINSRIEKTNTMNVSKADTRMPSTARAASGPTGAFQPSIESMSCTTGRTSKAMTMPSTGGSQTEFLKKLARRCLCSQVMGSLLAQRG